MTPQQDEEQPKVPPLVPEDAAADLPRLQASYLEKTGGRFTHYFCPFMHTDEAVRLCMGHVVPESYAGCCRARVAQRADVDSFYGAVAEAHFGTLLEARTRNLPDLFLDKKLQREMRPRLVLEGEEVDYYPDRGGKKPEHTRVLLESPPGGRSIDLVFKRRPEEMMASLDKNWGVVVERDCRLTGMVTLIKAAYLTLFHLHGYQWALSLGGVDIGFFLLGRFFRENRGKDMAEVRAAMKEFFVPHRHMVRPIDRFCGGDPPRGTLEDNRSAVCIGSSGKPFAQIVYVRIGEQCHGVLMPGAENPESAKAYFDFLNNDNEQLKITHTLFDHEKQQWEMHPELHTAHWPKNHATFEFD